jgi:hypothetical protein
MPVPTTQESASQRAPGAVSAHAGSRSFSSSPLPNISTSMTGIDLVSSTQFSAF